MRNNKELALTIFTPTYNRAHMLTRVFESLDSQTLKNFEWLVIDDGSTDDTENIIKNFKLIADFPIRYIYQENAGKQAAWNKAVELANGDFFCGLDSDDTLYNANNIEKLFNEYIALLDDKNVAGLRFLAHSNVKNDFHGKKLSNKIIICSWFDEFKNAHKIGERIDVFKTSVLKEFYYPVRQNVKFIPEIWFYVTISAKGYKFAYIPEPLRLFYDDALENRLSKSKITSHPEGQYIARSIMLKNIPANIFLQNPLSWIKAVVRYSQCANILDIPLKERSKNTNIFYASGSYLFKFMS